MMEGVPAVCDGIFGYSFASQKQLVVKTKEIWKKTGNVPPKVADTEVVFVSLRSLLDVKRSHNLSYWKVVPKSAVVPMAGTKTVPIGAEEREPCVGFYSGLFGLVFFKNADYCESVYEHSYLDDDVEEHSVIPTMGENQCIFVNLEQIMSYHMNPYNVVDIKDVTKAPGVAFGASASAPKLPLATAMPKEKSTARKAVGFVNTPADALGDGRGKMAGGLTTGESSASSVGTVNAVPQQQQQQQQQQKTNRGPLPVSNGQRVGGQADKENSATLGNKKATSGPAAKTTETQPPQEGHHRVAGPSDIREFAMRKKHRFETMSKEELDDAMKQDASARSEVKELYQDLQARFSWHSLWATQKVFKLEDGENDVFCSSAVNKNKARLLPDHIENIHYFHTHEALLQHLRANPVLIMEWTLQWKLLENNGWEVVDGDVSRPSNAKVYRYAPAFSRVVETAHFFAGQPEAGVHFFHSRLAVCQFINRFPFLLQDAPTFKETLRAHGWQQVGKTKHYVSTAAPNEKLTAEEIKEFAWFDPAFLFSCQKSVQMSFLRDCLRLNQEDALCEDREQASAVKSAPSQAPVQASKGGPNKVEDELLQAARAYVIAADDGSEPLNTIKRADQVKRMMSLLTTAGWVQLSEANWAPKEWWRLEKVTLAPWALPLHKKSPDTMQAGLDFFWSTDDIVSYLRYVGANKRNNIPVTLDHDYRDKRNYTVDQRIQEIAKEETSPIYQTNLLGLLEIAGWSKQVWPKVQRSTGDNILGHTFIPPWHRNVLKNEEAALKNASDFMLNYDYFNKPDDLVCFLREHGNKQPPAKTKSTRKAATPEQEGGSRQQQPTPNTENPDAHLRHFMSQPGTTSNQIVKYAQNVLGWKNVYTNPFMDTVMGSVNTAYMPPWVIDEHPNKGGSYSIDGLLRKQHYFVTAEEVVAYLKKHGSAPTTSKPSPPATLGKRRRVPPGANEKPAVRGSAKRGKGKDVSSMTVDGEEEEEEEEDEDEEEDEETVSEGTDAEEEESEEEALRWEQQLAAEKELEVPIRDVEFESDYLFLKTLAERGYSLSEKNAAELWKELHVANKEWCWSFPPGGVGEQIYSKHEGLRNKKNFSLKIKKELNIEQGRDYWVGFDELMFYIHGQFRARGDSIVQLDRQAARIRKSNDGMVIPEESQSSTPSSEASCEADGGRPATDAFHLIRQVPYRPCHLRDDNSMQFDTDRLLGPGESPALLVASAAVAAPPTGRNGAGRGGMRGDSPRTQVQALPTVDTPLAAAAGAYASARPSTRSQR